MHVLDVTLGESNVLVDFLGSEKYTIDTVDASCS